MCDVFMTFFVMFILRFFTVFKLLQFIEAHVVTEAPISLREVMTSGPVSKTTFLKLIN